MCRSPRIRALRTRLSTIHWGRDVALEASGNWPDCRQLRQRLRTTTIGGANAGCRRKSPAAQLLASNEAIEMAWGAYLAGEDQQRSLIPSILPLLKYENSGVRLAAIDALMRLDADVPEEDLASLLGGYWLDSALIFLSKDPQKHASFLMGLLDHEMGVREWDALNGILLTAPPPGYAARLLRDLTLRFTVCAPSKTRCPNKVMVAAPPYRLVSPDNPPGFPPQSLYIVENAAHGVPAVLVASPRAVTYGRAAYQAYYWSSPDGSELADRDALRWNYLALLAGTSPRDAGTQIPESVRNFHWKGPARYRADTANFLKSIRDRVTRLRRALIVGGLLTAEESQSGPKFEVQVLGQWDSAATVLPEIDWRLDR